MVLEVGCGVGAQTISLARNSPGAKIISIDKTAALAVPGVHAVLTHEDAPKKLFSTARHEHDWMDPEGGVRSVQRLKKAGNTESKLVIVPGAGHHRE